MTDAEFSTVERCLLLGDVDDKILNYQIGVIDDPFHQDKMEFKNADKIMNQIRNKEELPKPDRMTLERYLRLYDVFESILNYQCRADEENPFEISEQI